MRRRTKLIALLVILVYGGLLFVFTRPPDHDRLLARAQEKLFAEPSMRYEVALEYHGTFGAATGSAVTAKVRTDVDLAPAPQISSVSTFETRSETGGEVSSLAGETRRKDGTHFLRLAKANGRYKEKSEPLIDVWAKSEKPMRARAWPEGSEAPLAVAKAWSLLRAKSVPTIGSVARLKEILPEERMSGLEVRRYRVVPHEGVLPALFSYALQADLGLDQLPEEDDARVRAAVAAWGAPEADVWIGKRDGKIRKLTLSTKSASPQASGELKLTVLFSRFGTTVRVSAPEAEEFDDLLGFSKEHLSLARDRSVAAADAASEAPEGGLGLSGTIGSMKDGAKDGDGDGLVDTQEFFYGADAWNPDTDGDGWSDGVEVKKGANPVGPGLLFGFGL